MLQLDNIVLKDFAAWKMENDQIFHKFQENESVIYERLEPVYKVVNHLYNSVCEGGELDEDTETIFQVGFNYLHSQFEVIKIYYETLFQSSCDDFIDYSEMLLFLLYIFDIKNDLENHGYDSEIEELNELEESIENMIVERRRDDILIKEQMNLVLDKVFTDVDYEYVSIIDIYVEIAETFGIFLYEEKELVIGKEI